MPEEMGKHLEHLIYMKLLSSSSRETIMQNLADISHFAYGCELSPTLEATSIVLSEVAEINIMIALRNQSREAGLTSDTEEELDKSVVATLAIRDAVEEEIRTGFRNCKCEFK